MFFAFPDQFAQQVAPLLSIEGSGVPFRGVISWPSDHGVDDGSLCVCAENIGLEVVTLGHAGLITG